jgi:hypothetical protein
MPRRRRVTVEECPVEDGTPASTPAQAVARLKKPKKSGRPTDSSAILKVGGKVGATAAKAGKEGTLHADLGLYTWA